jgi:hypothetical protein
MLSAGGYPIVLYGPIQLPQIMPLTTGCPIPPPHKPAPGFTTTLLLRAPLPSD